MGRSNRPEGGFMREIKFRAWDKEKQRMLPVTSMEFNQWWVSCTPISDMECNVLEYGERNSFKNEKTDRHILMQFAGLTDKNGKEIYEGDILKVKTGWYRSKKQSENDKFNNSVKGETYWTVEHRVFNCRMGYMVYGVDRRFNKLLTKSMIFNNEAEVIGNIYENPELLEVTPCKQ
jgi:uncharacterized phage protein (TIGR01671 family)